MSSLNLSNWRLFADLGADDANLILGACTPRVLLAGEELFLEGEGGDSMWIIQSGRVEIYKNIRSDIDRTLASLGPGEIIGEMSFLDHSPRSAGARTSEPSEFLELTSSSFHKLQSDRPIAAAGFYRNLAAIVAERLRTTNELYRESVAFSIEATGASRLNLIVLGEELRPVQIYLSGGPSISGRILQMDHSSAGHTLIVKQDSGKLTIVPYHAVQRIELE